MPPEVHADQAPGALERGAPSQSWSYSLKYSSNSGTAAGGSSVDSGSAVGLNTGSSSNSDIPRQTVCRPLAGIKKLLAHPSVTRLKSSARETDAVGMRRVAIGPALCSGEQGPSHSAFSMGVDMLCGCRYCCAYCAIGTIVLTAL